MHDENAGLIGHPRDRREVARDVERQLLVDHGVDGEAGRAQEQRVAVGRRLRRDFGADDARGARAIVHDYLLAERVADRFRQDACIDVGAPTRRKRHDEPDRSFGIAIRRRDRGRGQRCERCEQ